MHKSVAGATTGLVVASLLLVYLLAWLSPEVMESWNAQLVDRLFTVRASSGKFHSPFDTSIIHVDISDKTLRSLKNEYLNRADLAAVSRNLADMKIAAQIWDFIFPARLALAEDTLFINAIRGAKNVYLGAAFRLSQTGVPQISPGGVPANLQYLRNTKWSIRVEDGAKEFYYGFDPLPNFEELASVSKGTGYLNLNPDHDGVFRRAPLLIHFDGEFFPSIDFRAACDYLNVPPESVLVKAGTIVLHGAHRPGKEPHDIRIPIDRHGNMIVSYVGPWDSLRHYDFATIWNLTYDEDEKEMMGEELSGSIAVVDQVTTGSADVGPIPTDENCPLSGVHSNVMNTILQEDFLREVSAPVMLGVEIVLMGILLWLSLRFSSLAMSVGMIVLLGIYIVAAAGIFLYAQLILNILRPSLMIGTTLVVIIAYRYFNEEKEKEVLRRSFEAYFPQSVVKKIMANPDMITSAGQKKELTMMFTDIKGFTSYSAKAKPDQIQQMLNEYFDAMVEIVFRHGGTVDKFMGDGLMVFFGDPESQPDNALRCVRAAIDMQRKVREIRERWVSEGKMPLQIRIGVNTGQVIVGNMGSARRLSYTVIGSDVNLAQRLESNSPVNGILISHATYEKVKDFVQTRPRGPIQVKGLDEPVSVHEVIIESESSS